MINLRNLVLPYMDVLMGGFNSYGNNYNIIILVFKLYNTTIMQLFKENTVASC